MIVENVFGNRYTGSVGKQLTAATWKGRNYLKRYFKPAQPRTARQVGQRSTFTAGVTAWQGLTATQKLAYSWMERYLKKNISSFNMMLSKYIEIINAGESYVAPSDGAVACEDSVTTNPIEGAKIVIKKTGQAVTYGDGYTEADGEFDLGIPAEDQNYDVYASASGYVSQVETNKTAAEVVALTFQLVAV
jgi:hypothetical protein